MTRSSKKEPFVEERLMERILRMNENNERGCSRRGAARR